MFALAQLAVKALLASTLHISTARSACKNQGNINITFHKSTQANFFGLLTSSITFSQRVNHPAPSLCLGKLHNRSTGNKERQLLKKKKEINKKDLLLRNKISFQLLAAPQLLSKRSCGWVKRGESGLTSTAR